MNRRSFLRVWSACFGVTALGQTLPVLDTDSVAEQVMALKRQHDYYRDYMMEMIQLAPKCPFVYTDDSAR